MLLQTGRSYIALFVTAVALLVSVSCASAADMYACIEKNGTFSFTNTPTNGDCKEFVETRKYATNVKPTYSFSYPAAATNQPYRPSSLDPYIWEIGTRYNVDPHLIKAVIRTESAFDNFAISEKGAQGLMQLMPGTARELHVRNPFNAQENIDGGTRYLRQMLDTFDGDLKLSLAAYNAGPGAVMRANGIPSIPETQNYVTLVMKHYRGYRGDG